MKNRIKILLCSLLLLVTLIGCDGDQVRPLNQTINENMGARIVLVYEGKTDGGTPVRIYADSKTKVMYLYMKFDRYRAGFTIMEDEEGKPLLWED